MSKEKTVQSKKGKYFFTNILDNKPNALIEKYSVITEIMPFRRKEIFIVKSGDERYLLKTLVCNIKDKDAIDRTFAQVEASKKLGAYTKYVAKAENSDRITNESKGTCRIESLYESGGDNLWKANLSDRNLIKAALQTAEALECAHNMKIYHTNIKPENIYYSNDSIKILDFEAYSEDDKISWINKYTQTIDKIYIPPECFKENIDSLNLGACDIFCWGMCFLMLISNNPEGKAFNKGAPVAEKAEIYEEFLKQLASYEWTKSLPRTSGQNFIDILIKALAYSPEVRPNISQIKERLNQLQVGLQEKEIPPGCSCFAGNGVAKLFCNHSICLKCAASQASNAFLFDKIPAKLTCVICEKEALFHKYVVLSNGAKTSDYEIKQAQYDAKSNSNKF